MNENAGFEIMWQTCDVRKSKHNQQDNNHYDN